MKPSEQDVSFRYLGYIIGMNLLCIGINLNIRSDLGVAAFSTLPYALSQVFTGLTFGEMNVIIYILLVSLQFLIERHLSLPLLAEIPFSFVFGLLVDFYGLILPAVDFSLSLRIPVLLAGNTLSGIGVFLMVRGQLVVAPVDGIVASVSKVYCHPYSICKNCFDLSMLSITVIFCLLWHTPFYGIGLGTIFSAFYVGRVIRLCEKVCAS